MKPRLLRRYGGMYTAHRKLYFKNTENLIAKLNTTAKGYLREQSIKELQSYLLRLFTPKKVLLSGHPGAPGRG